jgi:translation initiation factor IF-3
VRVIDDRNEQLGVMGTDRARALANEREMDLVEVAPQAQPPVARIMDYGKFKFESLKKDKDGRRKHNVIKVKEMKLRPKIGEHDFQTKFHAVKSFLEEGDKVKLTIMFRGREMVHQDIGKNLLDRMARELRTISTVERLPLLEGKNMIMILAPAQAAQGQPPQTQTPRREHVKGATGA